VGDNLDEARSQRHEYVDTVVEFAVTASGPMTPASRLRRVMRDDQTPTDHTLICAPPQMAASVVSRLIADRWYPWSTPSRSDRDR